MKVLLDKHLYERNLSYGQAEKLTGIPKSTLRRIAIEKVSPSLTQLKQIAKGLNIRITDLFEDEYK